MAARVAHNHEVAGSSPAPATKMKRSSKDGRFILVLRVRTWFCDQQRQLRRSQVRGARTRAGACSEHAAAEKAFRPPVLPPQPKKESGVSRAFSLVMSWAAKPFQPLLPYVVSTVYTHNHKQVRVNVAKLFRGSVAALVLSLVLISAVCSMVLSTYVLAATPDTSPVFLSKFGTSGSGNGLFQAPSGMALNADGSKLYVVDANNSRVQIFNTSDNSFAGKFGGSGGGDGQFSSPAGLVFSKDYSKLYVADMNNRRVQIFNTSDNSYAGQFGSYGSGDGEFNYPKSLAVSTDGTKLYVLDYGDNRVQIFNTSDNSYVGQFGSGGSGDGEFSAPVGIVVSPDGNKLYILDFGNHRVQIFNTSDNSFAGEFGSQGGSDGQFNGTTYDLAISPDGSKLYVADSDGDQVQIFNTSDNSFAGEFGGSGSGDGQMAFPLGVTVSPDGSKVYVAEQNNARISVFNYPNFIELGGSGYDFPIPINTPANTELTCSSRQEEGSLTKADSGYDYPLGFVNFCFTTQTSDNEVSLLFVTSLKPDEVSARKYNPTSNTYTDIAGAVITESTYSSHHALLLTYTITDNGPLDLDSAAGSITDPVGLAVSVKTLANTGTSTVLSSIFALSIIVLSVAAGLLTTKKPQ